MHHFYDNYFLNFLSLGLEKEKIWDLKGKDGGYEFDRFGLGRKFGLLAIKSD